MSPRNLPSGTALCGRRRIRLGLPSCGLLAALAVALGVGCGPVEYMNQVTLRASSEVAAARAAGADKHAIYEFTMAVEYLHKAREEAGYADYQAAIRLGKTSEQMAREARRISLDKTRTETGGSDEAPDAAVAPVPEGG